MILSLGSMPRQVSGPSYACKPKMLRTPAFQAILFEKKEIFEKKRDQAALAPLDVPARASREGIRNA
jgi:hypothetical protein